MDHKYRANDLNGTMGILIRAATSRWRKFHGAPASPGGPAFGTLFAREFFPGLVSRGHFLPLVMNSQRGFGPGKEFSFRGPPGKNSRAENAGKTKSYRERENSFSLSLTLSLSLIFWVSGGV